MRYRLIFTAALMLLVFNHVSAQDIDYKGLPEWSWHKKGNTEYYLYTPKNMQARKKYPVALFLHGCCGVDDHATLRNVVDAPARMWHSFGENKQRVPTYIIAPATSKGWAQHFPDLKAVMDSLITSQNADAKRMYICGFSMGAQGTFTFINQYPDYFAAAITMGMKFSGDSLKVKNVPMWVNQGETDYYSRPLRKQVKMLRALNGNEADTGATWNTGVNPRYSNFKGYGHVMMWEGATRQDLLSWVYSKVNDSNKYPNVYFSNPAYGSVVEKQPLKLFINANDPDGKVVKVTVFVNHKLVSTLNKEPYVAEINPSAGKNFIEAVATDDKGKSHSATLIVNTAAPLVITTKALPVATAGKYYNAKIEAKGFGQIHVTATGLPAGLELYPDGALKGIPIKTGRLKVNLRFADSTSSLNKTYALKIKPKFANEVLATDVKNKDGVSYKISKLMKGETPNFNSKDTSLSIYPEEISFSNLGNYEGLTYIKGDVNDTSRTEKDLLRFNVDEKVTVYVAYEVHDLKYHSTIPNWLKDFKKEPGQVVAQYRYFNVYARDYPKGTITLPGADARKNGVSTNYFVIIKKRQ
ncbi:hypothetical protein D0C36_02760 [Mucilaginibacter conchicola]|uniref:Peptidase S9 prolyl oligopeptidase catalytic domain-containing protein n=1 Tax=Mucilaginibacter conchicola TaxID=2303333 RepID=A0A372NY97_9SPHI|nr:Ig-like domain-containing protein [Mucilaginibacter conchicola]RFZ94487.1 hypothetical protein D0C36_02760 [Mucilaginibacter conchicola]